MTRSIAYFSMEIGIKPEIKTYSGGLGVLAGDTLKAAADHGLDFTGVTLLYRNGYLRQELVDGEQEEHPQEWEYDNLLHDTGEKVTVEIEDREVDARVLKCTYEGMNGDVDVIFLDTGLESNTEEDQKLTSRLYMGDEERRLGQEMLLGVGGKRALEKLGVEPDYHHMNEGHSALLTVETDGEMVFTTHTPVPAGHDTFKPDTVRKVLPEHINTELDLSTDLNMTELALKHSKYANGVSDKHRDVSKEMFPEYDFDAVTNGVHSSSWTAEPFSELYDEHIQRWRTDPSRLRRIAGIEDSKIWEAKKEAKEDLIDTIDVDLDPEIFTIGFARRSTGYKRPGLIFSDLQRLEEIASEYEGLQLIFGGKAHPDDTHGKEIISQILKYSDMLEETDVHFIEDYGMDEGLKMVSGVDLWLNNPVRGQEASGTSGMKAAHNGTPQLSTPDGWWLEGEIEGVTGWYIGEDYVEGEDEDRIDSRSLYEQLDQIISIYHDNRKQWIGIMKSCIELNASHFNTDRMLKEYLAKAYQ